MKKYLFGILAIALAVGFSAFTMKAKFTSKIQDTYYIWDGQNDQTLETSYTTQTSVPSACDNASQLCWFRVPEGDSFSNVFSQLDTDRDGDIDSDDGSEDGVNVELKQ